MYEGKQRPRREKMNACEDFLTIEAANCGVRNHFLRGKLRDCKSA
jgi:hypothetical protein